MGPERPGCSCWEDCESQLCKRLTSLLPNPPLRFPLGKEAPAWGRGVVTGPPGPVSEKQAFSR